MLVGINLLREGLDLPEVSLVAIFDADKEGFLRSPRSLIQTIGRAARNVNGRVIMYADNITAAMKNAIEETDRRRKLQEEYNAEHGIVPATVVTRIKDINPAAGTTDYVDVPKVRRDGKDGRAAPADLDLTEQIRALRAEMFTAAENLEFERAAKLRDELKRLEGLSGKDGANGAPEGGAYDPYASSTKKARPRGSGARAARGAGGQRGRWKR